MHNVTIVKWMDSLSLYLSLGYLFLKVISLKPGRADKLLQRISAV